MWEWILARTVVFQCRRTQLPKISAQDPLPSAAGSLTRPVIRELLPMALQLGLLEVSSGVSSSYHRSPKNTPNPLRALEASLTTHSGWRTQPFSLDSKDASQKLSMEQASPTCMQKLNFRILRWPSDSWKKARCLGLNVVSLKKHS